MALPTPTQHVPREPVSQVSGRTQWFHRRAPWNPQTRATSLVESSRSHARAISFFHTARICSDPGTERCLVLMGGAPRFCFGHFRGVHAHISCREIPAPEARLSAHPLRGPGDGPECGEAQTTSCRPPARTPGRRLVSARVVGGGGTRLARAKNDAFRALGRALCTGNALNSAKVYPAVPVPLARESGRPRSATTARGARSSSTARGSSRSRPPSRCL